MWFLSFSFHYRGHQPTTANLSPQTSPLAMYSWELRSPTHERKTPNSPGRGRAHRPHLWVSVLVPSNKRQASWGELGEFGCSITRAKFVARVTLSFHVICIAVDLGPLLHPVSLIFILSHFLTTVLQVPICLQAVCLKDLLWTNKYKCTVNTSDLGCSNSAASTLPVRLASLFSYLLRDAFASSLSTISKILLDALAW